MVATFLSLTSVKCRCRLNVFFMATTSSTSAMDLTLICLRFSTLGLLICCTVGMLTLLFSTIYTRGRLDVVRLEDVHVCVLNNENLDIFDQVRMDFGRRARSLPLASCWCTVKAEGTRTVASASRLRRKSFEDKSASDKPTE